MSSCHYCPKTTDLRPYGPKGAMVCFACAMGAPDRKAEASRQFGQQIGAASAASSTNTVAIGTEAGPFPVNPRGAA